MGDVVEILYADDRCNALRFLELLAADAADAEVLDQPLPLQFGESREGFFDIYSGGSGAKINNGEAAKPKVAEVIVNGLGNVSARKSGVPAGICRTPDADFRDDDKVVGVGM